MTPAEAVAFLPLLKAYAEGATIQYMADGHWADFTSGDSPAFSEHPNYYRIKPEQKYRPWKLNEVPLGRVVRHKLVLGRSQLVSCLPNDKDGSVYVAGLGTYSPFSMLGDFTMDDGTPCGVLE